VVQLVDNRVAMTDHTHVPADGGPGSLPNLLQAYREQQQRMRALATEASQLRQKVLVAADEGAATIVPPLVAEISRLVASARDDLRQLVAQARAVLEDDSPWLERLSSAPSDGEESRVHLSRADDQICAALEELGAALVREANALRLAASAEQTRSEDAPRGDMRTTAGETLKGELRIWNRR
jgi:hypothetical protein